MDSQADTDTPEADEPYTVTVEELERLYCIELAAGYLLGILSEFTTPREGKHTYVEINTNGSFMAGMLRGAITELHRLVNGGDGMAN